MLGEEVVRPLLAMLLKPKRPEGMFRLLWFNGRYCIFVQLKSYCAGSTSRREGIARMPSPRKRCSFVVNNSHEDLLRSCLSLGIHQQLLEHTPKVSRSLQSELERDLRKFLHDLTYWKFYTQRRISLGNCFARSLHVTITFAKYNISIPPVFNSPSKSAVCT